MIQQCDYDNNYKYNVQNELCNDCKGNFRDDDIETLEQLHTIIK